MRRNFALGGARSGSLRTIAGALFGFSLINGSGSIAAQSGPLVEGTLNGEAIVYQVMDGRAIFEGDIILPDPNVRTKGRAASFTSGDLWPDGVVVYEIAPELSDENQANIQQAIEVWNAYDTPIEFVPRAGEANYLRFEPQSGPSSTCNAAVGYWGRGKQPILLPERCSVTALIHEMGHTVGLWHEQQRQDRNRYVTVLWENIPSSHESAFSSLSISTDVGRYDYASDMHYGSFSYSFNSRPTVMTNPPGIPVGETSGMSVADLDAVNRMYGRIPEEVTITTNPPGLNLLVDGELIAAPRSFAWTADSEHTLEVPAEPQNELAGLRYTFGRWNDDGERSHTITAGEDTVYTANFVRQMRAVVSAGVGGSANMSPVSPDDYYNASSILTFRAVPDPGYRFLGWTSTGGEDGNSLCPSISTSPLAATLVFRPLDCLAEFTTAPLTTITSDPPGQILKVDDQFQVAPQNFVFEPGSEHTVSVLDYSPPGRRVTFTEWSDGGDEEHTITASAEGGVVTARFRTEYLLTIIGPSSSSVKKTPDSSDGYYGAGKEVTLELIPAEGYFLSGWSGDLSGVQNPATITMDRDRLVWFGVSTKESLIGEVNALSFTNPGTGTPSVSPGEIISIFTADPEPDADHALGPPGGAGPILDAEGRVATSLEGTRVLFANVPGPILYASPNQVNVVVPYHLTSSLLKLEVQVNGSSGPSTVVHIVDAAQGIAGNGSGGVVALNEDGSLNGPDHPAPPGSVVTFWATGQGVTEPEGVDGKINNVPYPTPVQPVEVRVGGWPAEVLFAGGAPYFVAGAMQVNARIPQNAPEGKVSLYLLVGESSSPKSRWIWVGESNPAP